MEIAKPILHAFLKEWNGLATLLARFDRKKEVLCFAARCLKTAYQVRRAQEYQISQRLWSKKRSELMAMLQHRLATG